MKTWKVYLADGPVLTLQADRAKLEGGPTGSQRLVFTVAGGNEVATFFLPHLKGYVSEDKLAETEPTPGSR